MTNGDRIIAIIGKENIEEIKQLSSVTFVTFKPNFQLRVENEWWNAEVNQPTCEDAISRKAVLEYIEYSCADLESGCENDEVCHDIKSMPSVTPTQKTGEWVETGYSLLDDHDHIIYECQCSECRGLAYFKKESLKHTLVGAKYCPKCGADMRGEQNNV